MCMEELRGIATVRVRDEGTPTFAAAMEQCCQAETNLQREIERLEMTLGPALRPEPDDRVTLLGEAMPDYPGVPTAQTTGLVSHADAISRAVRRIAGLIDRIDV